MFSSDTQAQLHLYLKLYKGSRVDVKKVASLIGTDVSEVTNALLELYLDGFIQLVLPNRVEVRLLEEREVIEARLEGEDDLDIIEEDFGVEGFEPSSGMIAEIPDEPMVETTQNRRFGFDCNCLPVDAKIPDKPMDETTATESEDLGDYFGDVDDEHF